MVTRARRRTLAGACLVAVLGLAACSGGPEQDGDGGADRQRTGYRGLPVTAAAEPGAAPRPTEKPAGAVTSLPPESKPWGVAADHRSGSVVVALRDPGRLAATDLRGRDLRVRQGPDARMIDLARPGGPLLVPAEGEDKLYELELPSLRQRTTVPAGRGPHQAVRVGDTTFVTDERGHAVRALRDGETVRTFRQPVQPGGITAVGDRVAAVDVATNTLFVYDARRMRLVATLPAGDGPSHVVPVGGDRVAVCDVRGNAVLTYDLGGTPRALGRTDVPGRAFWVEADQEDGTVYAALSNTNKIAVVQVGADGTPRLRRTLPTVRGPYSMDLDRVSGTLYVAGYGDSRLQIVPREQLRGD